MKTFGGSRNLRRWKKWSSGTCFSGTDIVRQSPTRNEVAKEIDTEVRGAYL